MRAASRSSSAWMAALPVSLIFLAGPFMAADLSAESGSVEVTDAWIRLAPPGVKVHAGYLTVSNRGTEARYLVAVKSPAFSRAEMHISREKNGVATMEHLAQVTIPPGKSVTFAPGGLHVMLMGVNEEQAGDAAVPLTLVFRNGDRIAARALIKKRADMDGLFGQDGHGTHHHKGM